MIESIDTKVHTYLRRYVVGNDNTRARDEALLFSTLNYTGRIVGQYQSQTPPCIVVAYDKARVN